MNSLDSPTSSTAPLAAPAGGPQLSSTEVAATLASRIPSEAIAVYTTALAFLIPASGSVNDENFTSRWILAGVVAVLAVIYAAGTHKRSLESKGMDFEWPVRKLVIMLAAFVAWVLVIPGSPFGEFSWYTPAIGAAAAIVVNAFLGGLALFAEDS